MVELLPIILEIGENLYGVLHSLVIVMGLWALFDLVKFIVSSESIVWWSKHEEKENNLAE